LARYSASRSRNGDDEMDAVMVMAVHRPEDPPQNLVLDKLKD
jgi:hypothetical protein